MLDFFPTLVVPSHLEERRPEIALVEDAAQVVREVLALSLLDEAGVVRVELMEAPTEGILLRHVVQRAELQRDWDGQRRD